MLPGLRRSHGTTLDLQPVHHIVVRHGRRLIHDHVMYRRTTTHPRADDASVATMWVTSRTTVQFSLKDFLQDATHLQEQATGVGEKTRVDDRVCTISVTMPEDPTATMRGSPGGRTHNSVAVRNGPILEVRRTTTHRRKMPLPPVVRPGRGITTTTGMIVVLLSMISLHALGVTLGDKWVLMSFMLGLGLTASSDMAFAPIVTGTGKRP